MEAELFSLREENTSVLPRNRAARLLPDVSRKDAKDAKPRDLFGFAGCVPLIHRRGAEAAEQRRQIWFGFAGGRVPEDEHPPRRRLLGEARPTSALRPLRLCGSVRAHALGEAG